ncbi:MAG TPA: hypothetical protein VFW07_16035 [Parafilimonas sp.]|nr:hypothetical protein [Parafilimonas sp.]
MSNFITTDWLNLRSGPVIPEIKESNVLGTMPPGMVVEKMPEGSEGKWLHIKTFLGKNPTQGFASSLFLETTEKVLPAEEVAPATPVPEVHLNTSGKTIRKSEIHGRAYHLNEPGMISTDLKATADSNLRIKNLHEVVSWLDVERSARYAPTSSSTFCNIYAYDLAFGSGLYLPRVWWNEKAFKVIDAGGIPEVVYEKTVTELNANALTDWFENYGSLFGWKRVFDVDILQTKVNTGTPGFIVAQRVNLNRSGHIVGILPEQA